MPFTSNIQKSRSCRDRILRRVVMWMDCIAMGVNRRCGRKNHWRCSYRSRCWLGNDGCYICTWTWCCSWRCRHRRFHCLCQWWWWMPERHLSQRCWHARKEELGEVLGFLEEWWTSSVWWGRTPLDDRASIIERGGVVVRIKRRLKDSVRTTCDSDIYRSSISRDFYLRWDVASEDVVRRSVIDFQHDLFVFKDNRLCLYKKRPNRSVALHGSKDKGL